MRKLTSSSDLNYLYKLHNLKSIPHYQPISEQNTQHIAIIPDVKQEKSFNDVINKKQRNSSTIRRKGSVNS